MEYCFIVTSYKYTCFLYVYFSLVKNLPVHSFVINMIKFLLLAVLTLVKCNEDEVDFYEKLIDEEIEKSLTYRIPENANAYRPQNIKPICKPSF